MRFSLNLLNPYIECFLLLDLLFLIMAQTKKMSFGMCPFPNRNNKIMIIPLYFSCPSWFLLFIGCDALERLTFAFAQSDNFNNKLSHSSYKSHYHFIMAIPCWWWKASSKALFQNRNGVNREGCNMSLPINWCYFVVGH